MITLSELQMKEVVMLTDGKRLGHIVDLEIDVETGHIIAIIILEKEERSSFFQKATEKSIYWKHIKTIGEDIILIQEEEFQQISSQEDKIE